MTSLTSLLRWGGVATLMVLLGCAPALTARALEPAPLHPPKPADNQSAKKRLTAAQLLQVLNRHEQWFGQNRRRLHRGFADGLAKAKTNPGRAELQGYDLSGKALWSAMRTLGGRAEPAAPGTSTRQDTRRRWPILNSAGLEGANLQNAGLAHAELIRAHLDGADLRGANLSGSNLQKAHLRGADLRGANLTQTYMMGADLRDARLDGAILDGTFLKMARLQGATFEGVDLSTATIMRPMAPATAEAPANPATP